MVLTRSSASLDSATAPGSQFLADDAASCYKPAPSRSQTQTAGKDLTPSRRSSRLAERHRGKLEVVQEVAESPVHTSLHGPARPAVDRTSQAEPPAGAAQAEVVEEVHVIEEEEEEEEEELLGIMAAAVRQYCAARPPVSTEEGLAVAGGAAPETPNPKLPSWVPSSNLSSEPCKPGLTADEDDWSGLHSTAMGNQELYAPTLDTRRKRREEARMAPKTKGPGWFDLPAQTLDDDKKRELRLLRLRGAYDPKRFYKTFDTTQLPVHFQVGTVVNGPADYFAGRLSKSDGRNGDITHQLLADDQVSHHRKKRYARMQEESQKWSSKKRKRGGSAVPTKKRRGPKPKH